MSLLFLKSSPLALGSILELLSLKFSRQELAVMISGCYSRALRVMWKSAIVPHAFLACCFMKKTLFGAFSGSRPAVIACLYSCCTGVTSQRKRMPSTGWGIISSAHSSVESISVKEKSSVLSPIFWMNSLMTSGLDSRGIQFSFCCSPYCCIWICLKYNERIITTSQLIVFPTFFANLSNSQITIKMASLTRVEVQGNLGTKQQFSIFRRSMQVKSIQRTNTLTSLNKKATSKTIIKMGKSKDQEKENCLDNESSIFPKHPAYKFLRGTSPSTVQFKKFATLLYKGLFYSINNLKGPSQEYINKKKVKLNEPADSKKKFLVLDLDETLIHSVFTNEKTDVKFTCKGDEFKFNVRPYCFEFLANMSVHYNVYVFTAGTHDYAEPIITYLNQKKKTIQGFLHRKNCMETQNGFFIKDLRIIQNRELKDIIMIDNLAHSFGLQVTNGIPILEFLDNTQDRQLQGLEKMLVEMSTVVDVRDYLEEKICLKKILEIDQASFMEIEEESKKM